MAKNKLNKIKLTDLKIKELNRKETERHLSQEDQTKRFNLKQTKSKLEQSVGIKKKPIVEVKGFTGPTRDESEYAATVKLLKVIEKTNKELNDEALTKKNLASIRKFRRDNFFIKKSQSAIDDIINKIKEKNTSNSEKKAFIDKRRQMLATNASMIKNRLKVKGM